MVDESVLNDMDKKIPNLFEKTFSMKNLLVDAICGKGVNDEQVKKFQATGLIIKHPQLGYIWDVGLLRSLYETGLMAIYTEQTD